MAKEDKVQDFIDEEVQAEMKEQAVIERGSNPEEIDMSNVFNTHNEEEKPIPFVEVNSEKEEPFA